MSSETKTETHIDETVDGEAVTDESLVGELSEKEGLVINELGHPIEMLEGAESLINAKFDPSRFTGSESYFIGGMQAYAIVGNENAFWDNIKKTGNILYTALKEAIKSITDYYSGEGKTVVENVTKGVEDVLEGMAKLNGVIPVPKDSPLIKKERFFKEPSLEGLSDSDLTIINKGISAINSATDKLSGVSDITGLIAAYKGISTASLDTVKEITTAIEKDASEASTAADKVNSPDVPSDNEDPEVVKAKQEEVKENMKEAKEKGTTVKKIGSMRNKFLVPAKIVSSSLAAVEALKENKEFKG